ncbi:MAG: hypothetical protein EZS28_007311 [Streblomastix strix]|uniref:Uncharacterized protein n=1 Tax=Streblomastix strix TaxID=222440 RepID=A0A5J4WQB1_9EUKA|nr:MAG: hypothetical protein EZS28_007311 [Streblomastix strix]
MQLSNSVNSSYSYDVHDTLVLSLLLSPQGIVIHLVLSDSTHIVITFSSKIPSKFIRQSEISVIDAGLRTIANHLGIIFEFGQGKRESIVKLHPKRDYCEDDEPSLSICKERIMRFKQ